MSQKSSGSEKVNGREGEAEYQDFPSKFFYLTMPNHFVREHFYAVFQKLSGSGKFMPKRGLSRFSIGSFCVSQCHSQCQ